MSDKQEQENTLITNNSVKQGRTNTSARCDLVLVRARLYVTSLCSTHVGGYVFSLLELEQHVIRGGKTVFQYQ